MNTEHQDDPDVVRALAASSILRRVDGAIAAVWRAAGASRTARVFDDACQRWSALSPPRRHSRAATILFAAVITHLAWLAWQERPAGWLWLMIPAIAVSIGAVLSARGAAKG